jgi:hypothetical protein
VEVDVALTIQDLVTEAHETAVSKGWWDDAPPTMSPESVAAKLCLVHGEISEALEEVRRNPDLAHVYEHDGKPEGFLIEIADVMVRLGDLIGRAGLAKELEAAVRQKMAFNKTRSRRHGGKSL